jgi:hypothetical protein
MTKQCFPAYSPGLAARMGDPWYRVLRKYRPETVRPYGASCAPLVCRGLRVLPLYL